MFGLCFEKKQYFATAGKWDAWADGDVDSQTHPKAGTLFLFRVIVVLPVAHRQYKHNVNNHKFKGKGLPQQAEVAQGVPGRLRPRIFLTFGTTRVVGRQA